MTKMKEGMMNKEEKQAHFERLASQVDGMTVADFWRINRSLDDQKHPLAEQVRQILKDERWFIQWCGYTGDNGYPDIEIIECFIALSTRDEKARALELLNQLDCKRAYFKGFARHKSMSSGLMRFTIIFTKGS